MDELRLHLDGPNDGIDARALRDGVDKLLTLINSGADAEEEPSSDLWLLADLSLSSLDCAVRPPPSLDARGQARLDTVWAGLEYLAQSPGIPEGWSERTVQALVELVDLRKFEGVYGGHLGRGGDRHVQLDVHLRENAESSLGVAYQSLGEVQGSIIRYYNDGKKREVSVRDASGRPIGQGQFPDPP